MVIRGLIAGVIATVLLVAVLASARLFDMAEEEVLITMNDVEVIEMLPPPPPPEFSEPEPEEQQEEEPPPPAPSLDVPLDIPAPDVPTIAPSLTKVNLKTPLQNFNTDIGVADIPVPKPIVKKVYKPKAVSKPKPKVSYSKPKPTPKPAATKSVYSSSELDRLPRERKTGRFSWPSGAKGTSGTVKLQIEISTTGRVRVVKVISSTSSALTTAAKKVATGSLYTVPTYRGKPVKTQFYKTYRLQKPR